MAVRASVSCCVPTHFLLGGPVGHRAHDGSSTFILKYQFLELFNPPHELFCSFLQLFLLFLTSRPTRHSITAKCVKLERVRLRSYRTSVAITRAPQVQRPCPAKALVCLILGATRVSSTKTPSLCFSSVLSPDSMWYMQLPSGWSGPLNTTVCPCLQMADTEPKARST